MKLMIASDLHGSVSLPKDGTPHSYLLAEDGVLSRYDLETGEAFQPQG